MYRFSAPVSNSMGNVSAVRPPCGRWAHIAMQHADTVCKAQKQHNTEQPLHELRRAVESSGLQGAVLGPYFRTGRGLQVQWTK
ncbi:hypothetical protein NQZ68_006064 [Dissostichus eleginoides]|nr:hypothetical protein NQZ68_006064 [Dissostichus eleginoides]